MWATKPPIKNEKKEKKRGGEKDRNRFALKKKENFCACVTNKKAVFTSNYSENMPFFLQYSLSVILTLISGKIVQRREIGEKCGFFVTRRPSPKG